MMLFNIIEELDKVMERFKDFIINNKSNPFLWLGLFVLGLAVFEYLYNTLSKNK